MRPFKNFFGLAIGITLFLFIAKIFLFAFFAAVIMSIIYAVVRRVKNFISYDQNGEYYIKSYNYNPRFQSNFDEIEPLFVDNTANSLRIIELI